MKLLYKLCIVILICYSQVQAQKNSFKEEFTVNPDVAINVNTRHCDIEIKTWDKSKVLVEGFMLVEGEEITEETKDEFFAKWNLDVKGNSKEVDVYSRSNSNIDISVLNFDSPDYTIISNHLSDVSIGSLDILDSIDFVMPEPPTPPAPPVPPTPPVPPVPPVMIAEFDFDAYQKDKSYLEKWKEEHKDYLGENAKIKVGKNSISIKTTDANTTMLESIGINTEEILNTAKEAYKEAIKSFRDVGKDELKQSIQEAREELMEAREIVIKAKREERESRLEEVRKLREQRLQERDEQRQLILEKREEIKNILKNKSDKKIKRFIKITAPKNAKFNMDVKYGALRIKD